MAYTNFTNCTKQEYDSVIYSQNDENRCKIYFNNVELQNADDYLEKITFTKRVLPENGKKVFTLDNFIAEEVEIIIHDINSNDIKDKVRIELGTLVDKNNNIWEDVPMGVYNIQDIPTRSDDKITIKLRDNTCLFDFNYNAKPLIDLHGGTATKLQILQDICTQANVVCNVNSFVGSSELVGIYDNTITARMYVAYLAEQAGCIAKIDRNGALIFIPLNSLTTQKIPLDLIGKYVKEKSFKIERVVYEFGTIKFETSNDDTKQTLYISSSNPYISNQANITNIFNIVENFEIDSVEINDNILGNPSIDGYDLIQVYGYYDNDDNFVDDTNTIVFTTLANNTLIYNGKYRSKYKTEIGLEERTENTTINDTATYKKTIKSEIDLINGTVSTTVSSVDMLDNTIYGTPTYVITTDTTFQTDKTYFKLENNEYIELVEGTDYNDGDTIASVGYDVYNIVYKDSIIDTVNNNIEKATNGLEQSISSSVWKQASDNFEAIFSTTQYATDLSNAVSKSATNNNDIIEMKSYIRFSRDNNTPYIELGKDGEGSNLKLRITNTEIQFLNGVNKVAYLSNNKLYIDESAIIKKQVLGDENKKWITEVDDTGNLNTYWGG